VSTVVALGTDHALDGFALAGVRVLTATTDDEIRDAWERLGADVGLVILSGEAARCLEPDLDRRPDVLTVTMP
jgi:vacuolar-type H+-ATPase subunit F/Vma7